MMTRMRPLTDGSWLARAALTGDLAGLGLCLVVGLSRHGEGVVTTFLALAAIFGGSWLLTTWLVGTYRPISNIGLLVAIVIAIPLGVLIRAVLRDWTMNEILTVAGVLCVFGAFFIGCGRLVVSLVARRRGVEQ
jgi:hypothetical protein